MEDSIKVILAVISFGLIMVISINIVIFLTSDLKLRENERAIAALAENCQYSCHFAYTTRNVIISVSKDTVLFSDDDRICYRTGQDIGCRPCGCEVMDSIILNLTDPIFIEDSYRVRCRISKALNVAIDCSH